MLYHYTTTYILYVVILSKIYIYIYVDGITQPAL